MIFTTTPDIDARISSWSLSTNLPPETFFIQSIERALEDWEDYIDAVNICAEIDAGRMKTFSLDEVEKHLDDLNALEG